MVDHTDGCTSYVLNRAGGIELMTGFGREDTLTRARAELGPSNLLGVRWKRIILGMSGS
jgi:hypothetical protein